MPAEVRLPSSWSLNLVVTRAPRTAIPRTPPSSRVVLVAADATPACRGSTEPMTAAVIGAIVMAIPAPQTMKAGRITAS
jgi:hypothetical protein